MKKIILIMCIMLMGCGDNPSACNDTTATKYYITDIIGDRTAVRNPNTVKFIQKKYNIKGSSTGKHLPYYGVPLCEMKFKVFRKPELMTFENRNNMIEERFQFYYFWNPNEQKYDMHFGQ